MIKRPIAMVALAFMVSSLVPLSALAERHQTDSSAAQPARSHRGPQPDQTPGEGWGAGERHPMPIEESAEGRHRLPPRHEIKGNGPGHSEAAEGPPPKELQHTLPQSATNGTKPKVPPRPEGFGPPPDRNNGAREIPPQEH